MLRHSDPEIQRILKKIEMADGERHLEAMLEHIKELEETVQQHWDSAGQAAAIYFLACYKHLRYEKEESLCLALKAVNFAKEQDLPYYEMYAHNICGIIYEDMSDYSSCLDHYLTGFDLAMQIGEEEYAPFFMVNIGNLFMVLDDFENSLVYMINGFQGLGNISNQDASIRANMAIAALNIIEAYVGSGSYKEAEAWTKEQAPLLSEQKKLGMAQCFLILGRSRILIGEGDAEGARRELQPLLADTTCPDNFNDYYTINILLNGLQTALDIGGKSLAEQFLAALDKARKKTGLNTFDYKIETCRIRYFDCFLSNHADYLLSKKYFYPCYKAGISTMEQLSRTYANSLHMRTELDKVKAEQRSVQELNAKLQYTIDLDPFTGIFNKTSLPTRVEERLNHWKPGQTGAFLLIDIDDFKTVNDTYGHQLGDRVIEGVSKVMKELFHQGDIVGRLGGDEFGVFLVGNKDTASVLAQVDDLLKRVRRFRPAQQPECRVTLSIGVRLLLYSEPYDDVFSKADKALYAAKQQGRDRFVVAE